MPATLRRESELVEATLAGDAGAFRTLVEPHRGALFAHCNAMLGAVHDAEDALQEALARAWRRLHTFERSGSIRAWLRRIATNACLDLIAKRPAWYEPYFETEPGFEDGSETPEAGYERREGVELAFAAAVEHLPPRQRSVLILREALGYSAREVAEILGSSVASVNSALQRARATLAERLPEHSRQAMLRTLDEEVRGLVEEFVAAWESYDVGAMVATLAEDP